MEALDLLRQKAVEQIDVRLQAYALAGFIQMLGAHLGPEFGVVQQQIGELAPLLHQIEFSHPGGLALELAGGDPKQLGQHKARVVEAQCLVKIAGEDKALPGLYLFLHKLEFG